MTKNRTILALFGMSFLLLIISAITGYTGLPQDASGPLVFRFDPAAGEIGLLGGVGTFFAVLGIVMLLALVNFVLALEMYGRKEFLSYVIAAATLVMAFFFFIATSTITSIN